MSDQAPWRPGMEIGMAFNSFTQEVGLGDAVIIEEQGTATPLPSQDVTYHLSQVKSQSEMAKALNISASLAINTGGLNASGAGSFLNEEKTKNADTNFVIKCTVKNSYRGTKQHPKFQWLKAIKTQDEFLNVYGDTWISDFVEGGEFIAVVSITTSDTANIQKITADLKVAFSAITAGGAGSYDLTNIKKMSSQTVSVKYSGANGVNPDGKQWDIDLMLEEAAKFPQKVANAKNRVAVVLRKYDTLANYVNLALPFKTPSYDNAKERAFGMFDDLCGLMTLDSYLDATIAQLTKGSLKEDQLRVANIANPFPSTIQGFDQAKAEVKSAIKKIQSNSKLLKTNPEAGSQDGDANKTGAKLAEYKLASDIKARLPTIIPEGGGEGPLFIAGSAIAACSFVDKASTRSLRLYWQRPDTSIVEATYSDSTGWSGDLRNVTSGAAANTPLAVCASRNGDELRLFYLNQQGKLIDMIMREGDKQWSNGDLSNANLPSANYAFTSLAALRQSNGITQLYYQAQDTKLMHVTYDPAKKAWEGVTSEASSPLMLLGGSLSAALTTPNDDPLKETFSVFYQDINGSLQALHYDPAADAASQWTPGAPIFSSPLPPRVGVCAYQEAAGVMTVVSIDRSNNVISSTYDSTKKTWSDSLTVGEAIRSAGIAALWWPTNGSPAKRVYLQGRSGPEIHELAWDPESKAWKVQGQLGQKQPKPTA